MLNKRLLVPEGKVRLGIVGCGRISARHFEAIERQAADLELAAVCDSSAEVAEAHGRQHGVPSFTCLEGMLREALEVATDNEYKCVPLPPWLLLRLRRPGWAGGLND